MSSGSIADAVYLLRAWYNTFNALCGGRCSFHNSTAYSMSKIKAVQKLPSHALHSLMQVKHRE
jgi:hypothetical protein